MSGSGLHRAEWHFRNPLKSIRGKACRRCGAPATCAIISALSVLPACSACAAQGKKLGYSVVTPEDKESEN